MQDDEDTFTALNPDSGSASASVSGAGWVLDDDDDDADDGDFGRAPGAASGSSISLAGMMASVDGRRASRYCSSLRLMFEVRVCDGAMCLRQMILVEKMTTTSTM